MTECKRLREPDEIGPDCGCPPGACTLGVAAATLKAKARSEPASATSPAARTLYLVRRDR